MPQDSLRSVVYRSLVCDDPNGVVEYGTMRKSKNGLRKKEQKKMEKLGNSKGSSLSSSVHKEKELFSEAVKEESHISPPIQITEVSRGAQKLNLMIDSWSKGLNFDGQSKDIARDLLQGALDLQESLVMLCKLQEASNYLGQMKKIHQGGIDDTERNGHSEMQSGSHSLGKSTRSSVEELKKVIRDSLTKQKLLSIPSDRRKESFLGRHNSAKLDDFSDIPSTSSQSSVFQSKNTASMDWSVSSRTKEMKAKSPSVIGKLMGLEDFPLMRSPYHLKQSDSKKSLDRRRLATDIEMPNVRNDYFLLRNKEQGRKTLKQVIDTMHLKGLLKESSSVEGIGLQRYHSYNSGSKDTDEMPPIVLIKPLHFPFKEKEDWSWGTSSPEVRSLHSFRESESSNTGPSQGEVAPEPEEMHNKMEVKEAHSSRTFHHNDESLKPKLKPDKAKRKVVPRRSSIREERASNSNDIRSKQEVKCKQESANKAKLPSALIFHKKTEKLKKVLPNRNVPEEEYENSVTVLKHPDQATATSKKVRKKQESTVPSVRSKHSKAESSLGQAKNNATRNTKSVKESLSTSFMSKRSKCKQPDKVSNQPNKIKAVSTITSSDLENHKPILEETEPSQKHSSDQGGGITQSTDLIARTVKMEEVVKNKINLNGLLLSNPSFLRYAADIFELPMKQPIVWQATFTEEANTLDTRLFSDCANELMECRSRQISLTGHPLSCIHMVNPRTKISLEQLLGEVRLDLEKLKNYVKVVDEAPHTDSIHKMLESDIKCSATVINGMWDLAWGNGLSVNEADQVVGNIEKLVLRDLIEEIIVDFTPTQ